MVHEVWTVVGAMCVQLRKKCEQCKEKVRHRPNAKPCPLLCVRICAQLGKDAGAIVRVRVRREAAIVRGVWTVEGRHVAAVEEKGEGHDSYRFKKYFKDIFTFFIP